jgi:hypothetical protein
MSAKKMIHTLKSRISRAQQLVFANFGGTPVQIFDEDAHDGGLRPGERERLALPGH